MVEAGGVEPPPYVSLGNKIAPLQKINGQHVAYKCTDHLHEGIFVAP
jgi:hypothetical protein